MSKFSDYAKKRMERSGIIVDEVFTQFIYNPNCLKIQEDEVGTKYREIPIGSVDTSKYFYCHGNEDIFWLIEVSILINWSKTTGKKAIPIYKPNKGNFYEIDESLNAEVFTKISSGYYTNHESAQWLRNHPDMYRRLKEIVG